MDNNVNIVLLDKLSSRDNASETEEVDIPWEIL